MEPCYRHWPKPQFPVDLFFLAASAPFFPRAVRVALGRWAIGFFFFAAAAAFLILFLAAAFCAVVILEILLCSAHRAFDFSLLLEIETRLRAEARRDSSFMLTCEDLPNAKETASNQGLRTSLGTWNSCHRRSRWVILAVLGRRRRYYRTHFTRRASLTCGDQVLLYRLNFCLRG